MLQNLDAIKSEADLKSCLQPVVIGGDLLAYTWVRCFHETYGIEPIVLTGLEIKQISTSRLCSNVIVPDIDQGDNLMQALREQGAKIAAQGKVGLVLSCASDWYVRTLSQHKAELEQWYVVPYIDFPLLDEITQKERFYAICEEIGVPYPKTWVYDCSDTKEKIPVKQFRYPLIAKPSNSARYHYANIPNQKKIYTIECPEELTKLFSDLQASPYDKELIVQDLIPGADDGLRTITCFSDKDGNVRVWSTGRVLLEDHVPTAIGNPVCIMLDRNDEIASQAAKFLKHVGYRGFSNFDVKYDPRDNSYRFFEINTRPGRNTIYMQIGGANIVKLIVDEFVLACPTETRVACDEGLFTVVPKKVVKKTVKDERARDKALALYAQGRAMNPSFYKADTLAHNMWARIQYLNQIRKFKRWVWDVEKARG